jgi:hypothetical protein
METCGFIKKEFTLRAIIFVTINEYQVVFVLIGQVQGKMTCTVCIGDPVWTFLDGSRKVAYLGYRRFLVEGHTFRNKKVL